MWHEMSQEGAGRVRETGQEGRVRRDGSRGLVSGTGRRQVRRTGQGTGHEDVSRDRSGGRVRETGQEGRGDILQPITIRSVNSFTCLLS